MVEIRKVREFDYNGEHFKVFVNENGKDWFSKEEEFKDYGVRKYHYIFIDVTLRLLIANLWTVR